SMYIDSTGGNNYLLEASGTDTTFISTNQFGVYCKYTSSNATKFYFDDFYIGPIIADTIPPKIDSLAVISQNQLDVYFNEGVDTTSANTETNYSVNNGIGNPSSAVRDAGSTSLVHLSFINNFQNGIWNTLTTTGVKDLFGNAMVSKNGNFIFYLMDLATAIDIVINEVLFDPNTNGVEWVEIYNCSDKIIDLKEIYICNLDAGGMFSNIKQIAPDGHLIFPQDYIVLSKDQRIIKAQYITPNTNGFIDMNSFISLNNDSAYVVLINTSQTVIDKLHYHSEWHLPLLADSKGISLERINYDNTTQDEANWHSAAESVGGATPAYKNSQYTNGEGGMEITISPEVFSPDNDGYNDVLSISYAFDTPGMIGNVQIYDSRGRLEKTLVRNELLATSGTFFWDGITDEKLKVRIGIYVIYFEAFDTKGKVKKYKRACVVAGKM
ncbi:MAG: lamin tail domain-containing protein, partial [Bacteroidota bacterium]